MPALRFLRGHVIRSRHVSRQQQELWRRDRWRCRVALRGGAAAAVEEGGAAAEAWRSTCVGVTCL